MPIRVPLDREYRGSYYRMTHRATVLTRVHTREGIVGEAYAGDEDATLDEIAGVIRNEIAPRLIGENAFAFERCWELALPGHLRPAARPAHRPRRPRERRPRRSGTPSARRSASRCGGSGAAIATAIPVNIIGGYYGRDSAAIRDEVAEWRELGFRGCKFKVGGAAPERGRRAHRGRARGGRRRLRASRSTPTRATRRTRRSTSATASRISTSAGSRSRASGRTTTATCATCARAAASRCARARASTRPSGCRDLMEARRDRRLQLRRILVGRLRAGGAWRRSAHVYSVAARPPRGAAGRAAPAREPAARHLRRGLPPRPRPDLVEPDREPPAARRRRDRSCRRPGLRLGARRRLHRALPARPLTT